MISPLRSDFDMAEIGKGDPRWIVDNRVDGRNVNAWHW
jgi:hypothetical protein